MLAWKIGLEFMEMAQILLAQARQNEGRITKCLQVFILHLRIEHCAFYNSKNLHV